jgi:hypothetical protein
MHQRVLRSPRGRHARVAPLFVALLLTAACGGGSGPPSGDVDAGDTAGDTALDGSGDAESDGDDIGDVGDAGHDGNDDAGDIGGGDGGGDDQGGDLGNDVEIDTGVDTSGWPTEPVGRLNVVYWQPDSEFPYADLYAHGVFSQTLLATDVLDHAGVAGAAARPAGLLPRRVLAAASA